MVGGAIMSIVIELQQQSIESNSDVLALLRKALLVARKLDLKDFEEWVNSELNGYENTNKIPIYRKLHGELKAYNPIHGWIPVVIHDSELEKLISNKKTYDSIPSICNLLNTSKGNAIIPMQGSENALISKFTGFETKYALFLSPNSISNIIEQVKNKILDWSMVLEEKGIVGEGLSFSQEEKNRAKTEPQIVNYISHFYGDVTDSQFQQGTTKSTQYKK